eukprot:2252959-Alexandrium_andersonii.AAC.1
MITVAATLAWAWAVRPFSRLGEGMGGFDTPLGDHTLGMGDLLCSGDHPCGMGGLDFRIGGG